MSKLLNERLSLGSERECEYYYRIELLRLLTVIAKELSEIRGLHEHT